MLALVAPATVASLKGYTAISGWVADVPAEILDSLYARVDVRPAGRPSRSTLWRVCTDTDGDVLDAVIAGWTTVQRAGESAPTSSDTPAQLRLDGKNIRGAIDADGAQIHLLAACPARTRPPSSSPRRQPNGAKTRESETARALLETLDLRDVTVCLAPGLVETALRTSEGSSAISPIPFVRVIRAR